MMKKAAYVTFIVALLAASAALASVSRVSNVEFSYVDGYTVARIDIAGVVRFSHQTEVAKDGKPFRVIVDILAATHHLGAKDFSDLPRCPVIGIRTSQYSVKPEKVVRLVFDMKKETVYRIESDSKSVRVLFPDKLGQSFAAWSTASVVLAQATKATKRTEERKPQRPLQTVAKASEPGGEKTPAELNAAFSDDRLSSLQAESSVHGPEAEVTPTTEKPTISKESVEQAASIELPREPDVSENTKNLTQQMPSSETEPLVRTGSQKRFSDKDKWAEVVERPRETATATKQEPRKKPEPPAKVETATAKSTAKVVAGTEQEKPSGSPVLALADKEQADSRIETSIPVETKAVKKITEKAEKSEPEAALEPTRVAPVSDKQKPAAGQPKQTSGSKAGAVKPVQESVQPEDAIELKKDDTKSKKKSTSRFRRTPIMSRKIKGTLVAEFPKRLVIKYKTGSYRDPFETLINDNKVYTSPIQQRIPNVEGLRLVGVIESSSGANSALFEDVDSYGYILKAGDKVRRGYVLRVETDRVYFQIFEYGWSRTVALRIED